MNSPLLCPGLYASEVNKCVLRIFLSLHSTKLSSIGPYKGK